MTRFDPYVSIPNYPQIKFITECLHPLNFLIHRVKVRNDKLSCYYNDNKVEESYVRLYGGKGKM